MIHLQISHLTLRTPSPRAAGEALAAHISHHGFSEFTVTFPCGFEIEWTDPDLYLEPQDIHYFLQMPLPLDFVSRVYINWQAYHQALKTKAHP